jgi:hypothetical protein
VAGIKTSGVCDFQDFAGSIERTVPIGVVGKDDVGAELPRDVGEPLRGEISDIGFEMQKSSNLKISSSSTHPHILFLVSIRDSKRRRRNGFAAKFDEFAG